MASQNPTNPTPSSAPRHNGGDAKSPAIPMSAGASLASAGSHLQQAARAAADSVRAAAELAMSEGHDAVIPELAAARDDTMQAGVAVQRAASERLEAWQKQGAATLRMGEDWVRAHPVAAIGAAVAGGYLLSRLLRRR